MRALSRLHQALRDAPQAEAVAAFDDKVDHFFDSHLRGRPGWDRVMYGASAAGEHSMVWLGLGLLRGARQGQAGRALVRAGAAMGAESLLVNGLVKAVFRRQRPDASAPHPHHVRRPLTSSFPSGHASASFFAAALLRDTPWWPAYYVLAIVVASSRVHVRMHHASDVIAGAALGAALGEGARHVFPLVAER